MRVDPTNSHPRICTLRDAVATAVKTELDQAAHGAAASKPAVAALRAASQAMLTLTDSVAAHPVP